VNADSPPRKIIHVDMDAFYASVEQRDDAELRGKPVAVGGRQRGVVMAASYEARKFGVRSAMPSATAHRLCGELVFVKPRFDVYKEVSRQIREIFLDYTPLVEPLSLDEAYLDVTTNLKNMPLASDIAREIRARILERTGLTASAGISYNKFLAKIASDHRKPNGQYVITPEMGPAFVETLPVGKFHGIGPATSAKMNSLGLHSGLDMRNQSIEFMQANLVVRYERTESASLSVPRTPSPPTSQRSMPWLRNCSPLSTKSGGTAKIRGVGVAPSHSR